MHVTIFHVGKQETHFAAPYKSPSLGMQTQTSNATLSRSGEPSEGLSRDVRGTVHGTARKTTLFDGHYLRNRPTLDIGVLGYIGIV
jgi:hypothetical protein